MTVTFQWVDEYETVLHVLCQGRWTWGEVFRAQAAIHDLIAGRSEPVNFIVSWDNQIWIPGSISENMELMLKGLPPRASIGLVVAVRSNPLFEQLIELFVRLTGKLPFEFTFAETYEDACRRLEPVRT